MILLSLAAPGAEKVHLNSKIKGLALESARVKCVSAREMICSSNALQLQENRGDGADHQRVARQSDGNGFSCDGALRRIGEKSLRPVKFKDLANPGRCHAG
jgi:hypothetical protein